MLNSFFYSSNSCEVGLSLIQTKIFEIYFYTKTRNTKKINLGYV